MIRFIKHDGRQPRLVTIPRWAIGLGLAGAGLFGLALMAARRREKEISIRKVLGAEVHQLSYFFMKSFLKLLLIALLIGRGKALSGGRGVARKDGPAHDPAADPFRQRRREERDVIDVEYRIVDPDDREAPR